MDGKSTRRIGRTKTFKKMMHLWAIAEGSLWRSILRESLRRSLRVERTQRKPRVGIREKMWFKKQGRKLRLIRFQESELTWVGSMRRYKKLLR